MTNSNVLAGDNEENTESESIMGVDENTAPGSSNDLQYRLATERNRLRWEYQEAHEKDAIESYINEDESVKRRRSINQAVKMSELILKLQEALHSGIQHDVPKAVENLKKLSNEPFTTMALLYAPCVVKTIYLCCSYEESDEVRALAKTCYKRFEPCFGVPDGGTFESAFETEVKEFWEKQNTVAYDSEKYDWKQFSMNGDTSIETGNSFEIKKTELELKPDKSETIELKPDKSETIELKPDKSETKVKIETVKTESETDNKDTIKKEIDDCKMQIKKDVSVKTENIDDKSQIKKETAKVKDECKPDVKSIQLKSEVTVKEEEKMDSDDIEITYSNIKESKSSVFPNLAVKLEPVDLEKLDADYDSDRDCYILN